MVIPNTRSQMLRPMHFVVSHDQPQTIQSFMETSPSSKLSSHSFVSPCSTSAQETYDSIVNSSSKDPSRGSIVSFRIPRTSPKLPSTSTSSAPAALRATNRSRDFKVVVSKQPALPRRHTLSEFLKGASENNVGLIRECINQHLPVNSVDMFGWSALMCAAQRGLYDVLLLLLQSGADHTKTNLKGQTAADLARISGHQDVVSFLEEFDKYEMVVSSASGEQSLVSHRKTSRFVFEGWILRSW